jgi:four helix bundle protein
MNTILRFEDIEAWKKARILCKEISTIISETDLIKDYALRDQINRSSGSIMDNIAEGYERGGKKEFIQFLFTAKASAGECRSQLYRVFDRNYITEKAFSEISAKAVEISKMLSAFINYLKTSSFQGDKFR